MSYPAHVTLTNPDGDKAYDTDGMIALDEPKKVNTLLRFHQND